MSAVGETIVVGVADMSVVSGRGGRIVTHALGSCIGVTVFDAQAGVGGLLHFMLPKPTSPAMKEGRPPAMFASSGIPALFRQAYELGGDKSRLIVTVAGGAEFLEDCAGFQIGKRNRTMMKKLFFKNDIVIAAEDLGGTRARTMALDLSSGVVTISNANQEVQLWTP